MVDFNENNTVIEENNIIYWFEHRYVYGISQTLEIGTKIDFFLEHEKEYELYFNDMPSGRYILHKIYSKELEDIPFFVYVFMTRENSYISNNKISNDRSIFSVKLKDCIKNRENQIDFIIFNLRKKGLLLAIDNDTKETKQFHIQERLNSEIKNINLTDFFITKIEDNIVAKRKNYYTIINGMKYPKTISGKGMPIYIPFISQEDINGLNTYLVAQYEMKTDIAHLYTGDCVLVDNTKFIIIEMEFFGFNGSFVTNYILGSPSSRI